MPEWLSAPFSEGVSLSPWHVLARIAIAVACGGAVAWIHAKTSRAPDPGGGLGPTLVLLAGLIAMVTQVIGDNVARAFSLVGALSIVRFRTVVRDTRDTAFVIFAVAVGMAVGAQAPWVALVGIAVIGGAAFVMAPRNGGVDAAAVLAAPYVLRLRVGSGFSVEQVAGAVLDANLAVRDLQSMATARQGIAVDYVYGAALRPGVSAESLVKQLSALDGIQEVRWFRRGQEQE